MQVELIIFGTAKLQHIYYHLYVVFIKLSINFQFHNPYSPTSIIIYMLYSFKENVCNASTQDPIFFKKEKKKKIKIAKMDYFKKRTVDLQNQFF